MAGLTFEHVTKTFTRFGTMSAATLSNNPRAFTMRNVGIITTGNGTMSVAMRTRNVSSRPKNRIRANA